MKTFNFNVRQVIESKQTVTEEEIRDIVVDGIETGIGYWAILDNTTEEFTKRYEKYPDRSTSEIAGDIIFDGGEVIITDREEEVEAKRTLTLESILDGIKQNAEERPYDCDLDDYDSITCDCIFQYAIFGEVIFG